MLLTGFICWRSEDPQEVQTKREEHILRYHICRGVRSSQWSMVSFSGAWTVSEWRNSCSVRWLNSLILSRQLWFPARKALLASRTFCWFLFNTSALFFFSRREDWKPPGTGVAPALSDGAVPCLQWSLHWSWRKRRIESTSYSSCPEQTGCLCCPHWTRRKSWYFFIFIIQKT